jgi:cell division protein FtsB
MFFIGLLLLIAAAVFGVDFLWKNSAHIAEPKVFGESIALHTTRSLFVVGMIVGAIALIGIALMIAGLRRKSDRAAKRRQQRRELGELRDERDHLKAENAQLQAELGNGHAAPAVDTQQPTEPAQRSIPAEPTKPAEPLKPAERAQPPEASKAAEPSELTATESEDQHATH